MHAAQPPPTASAVAVAAVRSSRSKSPSVLAVATRIHCEQIKSATSDPTIRTPDDIGQPPPDRPFLWRPKIKASLARVMASRNGLARVKAYKNSPPRFAYFSTGRAGRDPRDALAIATRSRSVGSCRGGASVVFRAMTLPLQAPVPTVPLSHSIASWSAWIGTEPRRLSQSSSSKTSL